MKHIVQLSTSFAMALIACSAWGQLTTQEVGIDRPGSDLRPGFVLESPDAALCMQACQADPNCKSYTYVRPGHQGPEARCWLKSAVPTAVRNDCCISGVRASTAISPSRLNEVMEVNVDRPGEDLKLGFDLPQPNPMLCRQACLDDPKCKAYTYVHPGLQGPDARCWLKATVPASVQNDCCVSGVVNRPNALTPIQLPGPVTAEASAADIPAVAPIPLPRPTQPDDSVAWRPVPLPQPRQSGDSVAWDPIPLPYPVAATVNTQTLERLKVAMTRKELLDELSSNPAMRSTLEQVALSAQLKVSDLALAQLPMSIPETDSETPPQLLDLWKAPVHISPIEPGPLVSKTVSWGESEHPVGMMLIHNIYSWGSYCSITEMKERGWVCLATYATVGDEYGNKYPAPIQWRIYIQTPPGAGAYMIDIHLASFAIDERELTEFTHLYMGDERSGFQSVPLISKSDGTGVIGLFTIEGEQQDVLGAGAFGLMNPTAAMMLEVVDTQFCNFGGVTITRI